MIGTPFYVMRRLEGRVLPRTTSSASEIDRYGVARPCRVRHVVENEIGLAASEGVEVRHGRITEVLDID